MAVAAILVWKPQIGGSSTTQRSATKWDVSCAGAQATDYKCFERHYKALIESKGVAAAFIDVKDAYQKSDFIRSSCHELAHIIGRAAGDKFGDVAKAYSQGDDFCSSGYYHGVMQSVVAKIGFSQLREEINTVCAGVSTDQRYTLYHYNCVHGLGHGVMAVYNGELFDALHTCDALSDSWERESCFGGTFMENIVSKSNPASRSKYLKQDDLLFPCNAVDHAYRGACFLIQTSHALASNGFNFDEVFRLCAPVESDFRSICYQSIGRDASGSTISNPTGTRDICMKGPDYEAQSNCIIGAVKDFVYYFHSYEKGVTLCDVVDVVFREMCIGTAKAFEAGLK